MKWMFLIEHFVPNVNSSIILTCSSYVVVLFSPNMHILWLYPSCLFYMQQSESVEKYGDQLCVWEVGSLFSNFRYLWDIHTKDTAQYQTSTNVEVTAAITIWLLNVYFKQHCANYDTDQNTYIVLNIKKYGKPKILWAYLKWFQNKTL